MGEMADEWKVAFRCWGSAPDQKKRVDYRMNLTSKQQIFFRVG